MSSVILHNPKCSTSRNALAIMQASGETPEVIDYLKNPPSRDYLAKIADQMNAPVRELLRSKEALSDELGLNQADVTDEQLLDAIADNPILINRPVVITSKGAVVCRPLERIFEVLENPVNEFTKENGDVIYNTK